MSLRLSGGRKLPSPVGDTARPTASRVRLAVINLLTGELPGCHWLDLCCGSGVMACEALQRGAASVVGIEQDPRIAALAKTNLEAVAGSFRHAPRVQVVRAEVCRWLAKPRQLATPQFQLIYADPPYRSGLYPALAAGVLAGDWLQQGGLLILECATSGLPEVPIGWALRDQRRYGSTSLMLLGRASAVEHAAAAVLVPGSHKKPQHGDWN